MQNTIQTTQKHRTAYLFMLNDIFYQLAMKNHKSLYLRLDLIMDFYNFVKAYLNQKYPAFKNREPLRLRDLAFSDFCQQSILSYCAAVLFSRSVSKEVIQCVQNLSNWSLNIKSVKEVKKVMLVNSKDLLVYLIYGEDYQLSMRAMYKAQTKAIRTVEPSEVMSLLLGMESLKLPYDHDSISYIFLENDIKEIQRSAYSVSNLGDICLSDLDQLHRAEILRDENRIQLLWQMLNFPRIIKQIISVEQMPDL